MKIKKRNPPANFQKNKEYRISIVIPFRDEALNLTKLLDSLINQDFNGEYEIILVNDNSTDDFMEKINKFKKLNPQTRILISVIDNIFRPELHLTSKQHAIETGINHASFEWIAFTDADMILEKNWLSSLADSLTDNISIDYGHTVINKNNNSFFVSLQAFQLEFLFATTYSFHFAGIKGSCMGNNMLIAKKVYYEIGGESAIGYNIVEDQALLTSALKKGFNAGPVKPFIPTAITYPCSSIKQFFHQMLRWIKGGSTDFSILHFIIIFFGLQNAILLTSIAGLLPLQILCISISNFILLWIHYSLLFIKIESREKNIFFPLFYLIIVIETIIMVIPVIFMSPEWKRKRV